MLTQTETSYFFLSFIKQYRPKTSRIGKFVGSDDFLICKGKVYRLVERFKGGQINVVNDNHSEWPLTVIWWHWGADQSVSRTVEKSALMKRN